MISVSQNVEYVTEHGKQVLLVERVGDAGFSFREVSQHLDSHYEGDNYHVSIDLPSVSGRLTVETDFCDITHGVLDSPDDGVHEQLELRRRQLEQRREARGIDSAHHLEETDSVFGVFRKILVDHVQCRLEYCVQDGANLGSQERLRAHPSAYMECDNDGTLTPRTPMIVAIKFKTSASRAAGTFLW